VRVASINWEQKQSFFWRDRTYVSCWNTFPQENAGLWRIYGDDKGLVIRTTWKSLRSALTGPSGCVEEVFFGPVLYKNFDTDEEFPEDFTDQYFVKRNEFVHEREFRLVAHDKLKEHNYNDVSAEGLPQFATIDCDLNTLIEELVLSPRLGGWVRNAVANVSSQYGGRWPVTRSNLYQPPVEKIDFF
jgi:hypothetical protein